MTGPRPEGALPGIDLVEPLTAEEDHERRRLNLLAKVGQLSEQDYERFVSLTLRERRQRIREPRQSNTDELSEPEGPG